MNGNLCLIQLLSEQTMQNILAPLALSPIRIVHLVTPRVMARSGWIFEALRQIGKTPEREIVQLSAMPTIPETAQVVHRIIGQQRKSGQNPVVNFTGGTKMMSIGAYAAASKLEASSVYVDTDDRIFVDGHTGPALVSLMGEDLSFTPYQSALTVSVIAVANGCERVTGGQKYDELLPLATHLLQNPTDEAATWEAMDGKDGMTPDGREPRKAEGWKTLCSISLNLPAEVARLAAAAGLVVEKGGSYYLGDASCEKVDSRRLQTRRSILAGGWWEVAVANAVKTSGRFRDIRWSADAGQRQVGGSMEEDLLAVDGVKIAYFSCKRGGARGKLMRQLEEMSASAKRLGGSFVSKYFCVYLPPEGVVRDSLEGRAKALGIKLITRSTLQDCSGFDG